MEEKLLFLTVQKKATEKKPDEFWNGDFLETHAIFDWDKSRGDDCKNPCQVCGECKDKSKEKCGDDCKNPCQGEVKDKCKEKCGDDFAKTNVQLEVNVKIDAKKNVETSGDNCKDPCWAQGESKHECKERSMSRQM